MTFDISQKKSEKSRRKSDDDDFDDLFKDDTVSEEGNRIYFYNDVDKDTILNLNKSIRKISNMMVNKATSFSQEVGNIFLHINSPGGSLTDGLLASDYIRTNNVPIWTIIDGTAASAATIMSVVGKKRLIHKNSFMLIHQLSSEAYGSYANLKDDMYNCEIFMQTIRRIYKEYTKIPHKKLNQILAHDIWFSANECLRYGMVDQIIE